MVVGCTMPAWGPHIGIPALVIWLRRHRAHRHLYPLWRDLYQVNPEIALLRPLPRLIDALILYDLDFRLYRRVVEIRDGILGGVSALFATLVPLLYLLRGVRRRQFTDHHVRLREQRPLAFLVGIASLLIGLALMVVLGAPRQLLALIAAMGVGLIVSLLVTLLWKISVHVAVVAGAVVILVLVFGPLLLVLAPLVALVGWARVEVADHTPAQVIAGSGLGAAVAAVVFILLR